MEGSNVAAYSPSGRSENAVPRAMAFIHDAETEGIVRSSFADIGIIDGPVIQGGIDAAIEELRRRGAPRLLVIDVSGLDDPLEQVNRLGDVCEPDTEVVVIGERNDIVLYRDLKSAGVAEYLFKPLIGSLVSRVLGNVTSGGGAFPTARTGRLLTVMGVRGGVGTTTIAASTAWHIAEDRKRRAIVLDLDLHRGDAALQLDAQPSHALREALDHPERIDDLFLHRGVSNVTGRLGVLASMEPLTDRVAPAPDAVVGLLERLLRHYRYVILDLPPQAAVAMPQLLQLPSTVLLVSDGSLASARDVTRWRSVIGPNSPDRSVVHVLNKKGADNGLPEKELVRALGQPPDLSLAYDRQIASAAALGIREACKSAAMRRGMKEIERCVLGQSDAARPPLWKRMFR